MTTFSTTTPGTLLSSLIYRDSRRSGLFLKPVSSRIPVLEKENGLISANFYCLFVLLPWRKKMKKIL
jgi:hypothetical protein